MNRRRSAVKRLFHHVTPAKAGVSTGLASRLPQDDASLRWHDGWRVGGTALAAALLLAACSSASDQPGAVTADEARQLNEAAAMLDANSVALNAVTANESAMP